MRLRRLFVIASLVVAYVGVLSPTPAFACHDPHEPERIVCVILQSIAPPPSCTITTWPPSVSCAP